MKKRIPLSSLALASLLLPMSLPSHAASSQDITLRFSGEFNGQPADCSTEYPNIGLKETTVSLADYRLYVSRVRLIDSDGLEIPVTLADHGPWQHGDVALLDFEDGSGNCSNGTAPTNHEIRGQVPMGDYRGVAFDIGVPFDSNHQDPTLAASPLNLTALFWNWRGGYRFMRLDLLPEGEMIQSEPAASNGHTASQQAKAVVSAASESGKPRQAMNKGKGAHGKAGWAVHLGSTACKADSPTNSPQSCGSPNRVELRFAQADPLESVFVIDPAKVLADSDLTRNTRGTSPGCMSAPDDPECDSILAALGLSASGGTQALVSVR